jgi:hypothetical protein
MYTNEIVTSAGSLGVERRSHDRMYVTPYEPLEYAADIVKINNRIANIVEGRSQITRGVLRTVTHIEVVKNLNDDGMSPEAVIPLDDYDQEGSVLAYYATNNGERAHTLVCREEILEQTQHETVAIQTPEDIDLGNLEIYDCIESSQVESLYELWGGTFGWSREQIRAFARRVMQEKEVSAEDRSVWFAGLDGRGVNGSPDGRLVSAAMAERIVLPGFLRAINLIESTEWRSTSNGKLARPKHAIVAVLRNLHSQVLRDNPDALLLAECNFTSRADIRGHQSGLIIPSRTLADQLLVQNVGVIDEVNNWPLRDFIVMISAMKHANAVRQIGGREC